LAYSILGSLCECLFALHFHSADRYVSDGGLGSAAKQDVKSYNLIQNIDGTLIPTAEMTKMK